jgi:hypothetical protein
VWRLLAGRDETCAGSALGKLVFLHLRNVAVDAHEFEAEKAPPDMGAP